MTENPTPRVSIGLPVYNGSNFLAETLDAILAQTFADFELIITDNASTDETPAICRVYAARDPRIAYHRTETNAGAAANYNWAFALARGEYFKWSAHDDLMEPSFLACCVEALDRQPEVVLAFTRATAIDDNGDEIKQYPSKQMPPHSDPRSRFRTWVLDPHPVVAVFGLMRREVLAQTRLIGKYAGSDRPLLSELALLGEFYEVPEFLFKYRIHAAQSWGGQKSAHAQQAWYDPARLGQISFPQWRLMAEHVGSIQRSPLPLGQRLACYPLMALWVRRNWRQLYQNLLLTDVRSAGT